ncbi:MAG: peptidoglycan binding domain-containing protein, partial [Lachnospiraceae bacterium]
MKQTGQKHSIEIRVGIIVGILLILYIGISLFFINHYYFGTTLNGMNYGGKSLKQVRKSIVSEMEHYELTLVGRDQGSDVIAGSAIGLEYGFDNTLEQLLQSQKEFSWPIAIWKDHDYELPQMIAYQQQALEEQMQRLSFFDREEPAQDASILPYSAKTGTYELKKEKQGTTLDKEKTLIAIEEAIHSLDETLDLDKENCYVQPKILAADPSFLKIKDTLNQYVSSVIQYDFLQEEKAIHGEQISQWITYDAESVTIDDAKVREYVDAFASQYDTYGRNKLFTTQDGRELKLPSAYGWRLDRVAETRQLMADIQAGKSLIRE